MDAANHQHAQAGVSGLNVTRVNDTPLDAASQVGLELGIVTQGALHIRQAGIKIVTQTGSKGTGRYHYRSSKSQQRGQKTHQGILFAGRACHFG
jgi:hypothetical protein